jgi:hypothetical protein
LAGNWGISLESAQVLSWRQAELFADSWDARLLSCAMKLAIVAVFSVVAVGCVVPANNQGYQNNQQGYSAGAGVFVNGQAMPPEDAARAQIPAGRYWYDSQSGLWGLEGQAVAGVVQAGFPSAPLDPNISRGNTNVFVNGRHLPTPEVTALSQLFQQQLRPGRYFLNANGDMGVEGGAPLVNIVVLIQQRQAQTGGGGGDNIWSSRNTNSIGNESNGAGYVCTGGTCATYGM